MTGEDEAGNSTSSTLPPSDTTGVFSLFSPGGGACNLTCSPTGSDVPSCPGSPTVLCTTLADAATDDYDIPGDSPSPSNTNCSGLPIAFSGYADPSMRRDPLISTSNPYGTSLWMLYSWPKYIKVSSPCSITGVNEIRLAESDTSTGTPGGTNWSAWCSGTGCSTATPIWPSETFSTCAAFAGFSGTCYSSHEVSNFWPYANYPSSGSETWYAAHLMYYVKQGHTIDYTQVASGCLVMSVAGDLTALGWSSGGPSTCGTASSPVTFPANAGAGNVALYFSTLTSLAGLTATPCNSWGEPAIMVSTAPTGYTGNAVYLATSCITSATPTTATYYVFFSQDFTALSNSSWHYYSGPFDYSTLPSGSYPSSSTQPVNSITELDWAQRADGTIVAVVTPQYVVDGVHSSVPFQYGCAAVNFTLTSGWSTLVATVTDTDGTSADLPYELEGPNGCTYEPTSNTGIVIVRHLLGNEDNSNNAQNQFYSLLDTGVLP